MKFPLVFYFLWIYCNFINQAWLKNSNAYDRLIIKYVIIIIYLLILILHLFLSR